MHITDNDRYGGDGYVRTLQYKSYFNYSQVNFPETEQTILTREFFKLVTLVKAKHLSYKSRHETMQIEVGFRASI